MKFEIPFKLPSLNDYIDQCRASRYAGATCKKQVEESIMLILKGATGQISSPVKICFVWYEQTRRRDKDNVAFAKKFILDALQKSGKLKNDNNQYIAGFSDKFVYSQGDKVIVEIEEV